MTPRLITKAELAKMLALHVRSIENMNARGALLRPVPIGVRSLRWRLDEVEAWIEAGCPSREKWEARD